MDYAALFMHQLQGVSHWQYWQNLVLLLLWAEPCVYASLHVQVTTYKHATQAIDMASDDADDDADSSVGHISSLTPTDANRDSYASRPPRKQMLETWLLLEFCNRWADTREHAAADFASTSPCHGALLQSRMICWHSVGGNTDSNTCVLCACLFVVCPQGLHQ
jgi:hypothetical protein